MPPHFIELYAALAATDFFGKNFDGSSGSQYFMTAREQSHQLKWTDLPDNNNGDTVRSRIGQLARFAFAYLSVYNPALEKIADHARDAYRVPWYFDFFERRKIAIDRSSLNNLEKYCEDFLRWLANIQGNCSDSVAIKLIDYSTYAEKKSDSSLELKPREDFSNDPSHLIQSPTEAEFNVLHKLWERMCNSRNKGRDAQGIGKFIRALYENCAE